MFWWSELIWWRYWSLMIELSEHKQGFKLYTTWHVIITVHTSQACLQKRLSSALQPSPALHGTLRFLHSSVWHRWCLQIMHHTTSCRVRMWREEQSCRRHPRGSWLMTRLGEETSIPWSEIRASSLRGGYGFCYHCESNLPAVLKTVQNVASELVSCRLQHVTCLVSSSLFSVINTFLCFKVKAFFAGLVRIYQNRLCIVLR